MLVRVACEGMPSFTGGVIRFCNTEIRPCMLRLRLINILLQEQVVGGSIFAIIVLVDYQRCPVRTMCFMQLSQNI